MMMLTLAFSFLTQMMLIGPIVIGIPLLLLVMAASELLGNFGMPSPDHA